MANLGSDGATSGGGDVGEQIGLALAPHAASAVLGLRVVAPFSDILTGGIIGTLRSCQQMFSWGM